MTMPPRHARGYLFELKGNSYVVAAVIIIVVIAALLLIGMLNS